MNRRTRLPLLSILLLSATLVLAACGGSGGKPNVVIETTQIDAPPTLQLALVPTVVPSAPVAQPSPAATATRVTESRTPAGVPPVSLDQKQQSYRELFDSLGVYPGATLLREYTTDDGHLGRVFGTAEDIVPAATAATSFYRSQLKAQGWDTLQEHASISGYAKGSTMLLIVRGDSNPIVSEPGQKTIMTVKPAFEPKFYFAIEAGTKS